MALAELLTKWGFEAYIPMFEAQEVTLDALVVMKDETLSTVISKAGPRAVLLEKVRQHIMQQDNLQDQYFSETDGETKGDLADDNIVESMDTSSASTMSLSVSSESQTDVNLEAILNKHAMGPGLLLSRSLDASKRKLLVDILADHLIVEYGRPSKSTYLRYAVAVTKLFPGENADTYFIPSSKQSTSYGKLYFKVVNLNNKRRKMGLKKETNHVTQNVSQLDDLSDESTEEFDAMVGWLQLHQQPQSKLMEYWRRTAKRRLHFIHGTDSPSLHAVLQQWPRYKDKDGFILISEDFSILHNNCGDCMAAVWPRIYKQILERLRQVQHQKDKHLAKMMTVLETDIENPKSADIEMALALLFLPVLLPESSFATPSGRRSKKRSVWKPSILESMEHFVDVKEPSLDLQHYLKTKADKLSSKGLKLQPHVVVLSDGLDNIGVRCAYYACLHTIFYCGASLMEAVDTCVKAAFVFGVDYPAPANSCWMYVQRAIYNLTSKYDRVPSRVLKLISDTA